MDTKERILLYTPDAVQRAKTGAVLAEMGIGLRVVTHGEVAQRVGVLAGMPGQSAGAKPLIPPVLTEPMMVLVGLSRPRMDALFAALRAAGVPPCDRKAILTPTNMGWSFAALYEELGREHEEMHRKR